MGRMPSFYRSRFTAAKPHSLSEERGGRRIDVWDGGRQLDTYTYAPEGSTAMASAEVMHQGAEGSTTYPPASMLSTDEFDNDAWFPAPGQQPLFRHRSSGASSKVNELGGTKSARVGAMTLLGIAANDAAREFGTSLTPSQNLSKHSLPLVQGMAERGMVAPEQVAKSQGNSSDWWQEGLPNGDLTGPGFSPVSGEDISRGRRTLKSVLGRTPRTGQQQTLF